MQLTPILTKNHSSLNNLGWTVSGHSIAENEKVYAGDSANNNFFMYNSATDRWEFYRNNVLKAGL